MSLNVWEVWHVWKIQEFHEVWKGLKFCGAQQVIKPDKMTRYSSFIQMWWKTSVAPLELFYVSNNGKLNVLNNLFSDNLTLFDVKSFGF